MRKTEHTFISCGNKIINVDNITDITLSSSEIHVNVVGGKMHLSLHINQARELIDYVFQCKPEIIRNI